MLNDYGYGIKYLEKTEVQEIHRLRNSRAIPKFPRVEESLAALVTR